MQRMKVMVVTYLRGSQAGEPQIGRQHCTCFDPSPPIAGDGEGGDVVGVQNQTWPSP